MRPESWELAKRAFHAALEVSEDQRSAILVDICADDDDARLEARRMLAHADDPSEREESSFSPCDEFECASAGPRRIGRFEIIRLLGTGATGKVYRACDPLASHAVAVKVLRLTLESESTRRRLEYEGKVLAKFDHPGIARVYEVGTTPTEFGTLPYIAMEFVEGIPIDTYAEQHLQSDRERIELLVRVCDAVAYAHHRGVIHRDLKPANILIDSRGNPKLLDFGIARSIADNLDIESLTTRTGDILGTPGYMSPEQAGGAADTADTRADVYSLGVLLYELLARQRLCDCRDMSLLAALEAVERTESPLISTIQPHLRGDIEAIITKAIDRTPRRRYDTAAALAADLRRFLDGDDVHAEPVTRGYRYRRYVRRHRGVLTVATTVVVALTIAITVLWHTGQQSRLQYENLEAALRVMSTSGMQDARYRFDVLDESRPLAGFDTRRTRLAFDLIGAHLLQNLHDPEYAAKAYNIALDATRKEFGVKHQKTIRAVQVYAEALNMSGGARQARDMILPELDLWNFTLDTLSPQAEQREQQRLLRLAMTLAESDAHLGYPDKARASLEQILAAQIALPLLDPSGEHHDITETKKMIDWIDRYRDELLASRE